MAPAKRQSKSTQKSPAEFFAENKIIAGFDTPGKSLYTTVRELVENSLDAAERVGVLPDVDVTIEEISLESFNRHRGIEGPGARRDDRLYKDTETQKERDRREKQEAKERKQLEKDAEKRAKKTGEAVDAILRRQEAAKRGAATRTRSTFYKVTCRDNGSGMPHEDIPNMLGRVLSSTKYNKIEQTRGKFGLGAKMALMWSKMSSGQPIEVRSACVGQGFVSYYKLDMDIQKNAPKVYKELKLPNEHGWHGSELQLTIEGNWSQYRARLLRYLKLIAVITPYAEFNFRFVAENEKNYIFQQYRRRTEVVPDPPREGKHHPSCVDLELLKRMLGQTKVRKMHQFLSKEFCSIPPAYAQRLVKEIGAGVTSDTSPKALSENQTLRLHQMLHQVRFADPDGSVLSPAGEYNLRLGVMKELQPVMVATYQGDAKTHEGHAFLVEAAVCVGARDTTIETGQINVFRFANRIPLLFEGGNDVITKTANQIKWNRYKIALDSRLGIFVSIVSTKIPFKGTSKEYIGDIGVISEAVQKALQQCGAQLKVKIARQEEVKARKEKQKNLAKYIPDAVRALGGILREMAARPADAGPKRQRLEAAGPGFFDDFKRKRLTEDTLKTALTRYVDKLNTDQALEYQMQSGMGKKQKDEVCLRRRTAEYDEVGRELVGNAAALRLRLSKAA